MRCASFQRSVALKKAATPYNKCILWPLALTDIHRLHRPARQVVECGTVQGLDFATIAAVIAQR